MARIHYQEFPNADKIKVALEFGGAGEVAAAANFAFPFIATKICFVHQITVKTEVLGGVAATVQLRAVDQGEDYTTPATARILSDAVDVGSGGSGVAGGHLSSDLDMPDIDNTTDEFDLDGQTLDSPYEMAPGDMLIATLAGANIATFQGMLEVLISEQVE